MIILFFLVIDIVVSGFGLNQTSNLTSMDALQLFLTSTVIYTSNDGPWKGYQFPLSFMPSTSYIDGMCLTPAGICDLSSSNYQASVLQQRRLLLKYGLRIRDGAYWQLSLASMIKMEGKSSLLSLSTALDNLYSLGILSNKNTTENLRIQYAVYGNFEFVSSSSEYSWKNITTQNALLFQNIPTSSYLKDPISDPELVAGKSRPALAKLGSVRYLINDISMSDNVNGKYGYY